MYTGRRAESGASRMLAANEAPSGFNICHMSARDLEAIYQLGEEIYKGITHTYSLWSRSEIADLYRSGPDLCLVAWSGRERAGFALSVLIEKESTGPLGYLVWLGVKRGFRGVGLASALLRATEEEMANLGACSVILDVDEPNLAGVRFFASKGFKSQEKRVWMQKILDTLPRLAPK